MAVTERQMTSFDERLKKIERDFDGVLENNRMTTEMYGIFQSVQGGFRVLAFLGKIARPFLAIGALATAVWIYYKTGKWPNL